MNTYKVVASQLVWFEAFVRADSEEDAEDMIANDASIEFKECGHGDFEIEDIDEVSHE